MQPTLIHNFETVKFWIDDGILFCQFTGKDINCVLDEAQSHKYIDTITNITQGHPMPFLIDVRDSAGNFSTAAAKLIAGHLGLRKIRISEAFVVNSLNGKILISSYKRIFEPKTPYKLFNNMKDAIQFCMDSKKNFYANPNN